MRLSLSNLALPQQTGADKIARLAEKGLRGVEVAPTRIAPWGELNDTMLTEYRRSLAGAGISVSSLQAIFFGAEGIALLQDVESFERMAAHLRRVAAAGAAIGASVLVFGAPKQRSRSGLAEEAAFDLGMARFRHLAEIADAQGLTIGLEPVPAAYNGDFLCTWQEVERMVRAVNHPGLRVHLDTGCVLLGGGDIGEAVKATADRLCHFHIAEPKLATFVQPVGHHAVAANALRDIGYSRWVAIEMLEAPSQPMAAIEQAVEFAAATYPIQTAA
ncbi:sugar phosphate isomerase/epimerase family protein [Xanthobacter sp. ZOL 2024]